jgi:hypothetical protein
MIYHPRPLPCRPYGPSWAISCALVMDSHRHKLTICAVGAALVALTAGCQTPGFSRNEDHDLQSSHRHVTDALPKPTALKKSTAAADAATEAQVMKEAQQIMVEDPAAGEKLLEELSRAEPKLWPLTVQNFRSRQAFHDQLLKKPRRSADAMAGDAQDFVSNQPPSEEVGQLTDPRGIRIDPALEQAFARATPANMPAPIDLAPPKAELVAQKAPAAIDEDHTAVPLAANSPPAHADSQVVQASAVDAGHVDQALYSADAALPANATKRDWQQHVQLAIEDLNQRLADGPRSTAEVHQLVSLRILDLLAGNTEAALKPIPNVSTEEQDYWSGQLFALATFLDHHRMPDDDRRAAASVVHLDEAVGHLRELGSLALRNLAFCKNVYGYGAYEPINNPSFTPGQQVTLYLEVDNYHSESTQKGYVTKVGASYELVNEEGQRVANGDFPNVEDCCQSRRRDFHIQYGLVLPKTAKTGKYQLKLAMNDRQSDKMGSASIAFEIR